MAARAAPRSARMAYQDQARQCRQGDRDLEARDIVQSSRLSGYERYPLGLWPAWNLAGSGSARPSSPVSKL